MYIGGTSFLSKSRNLKESMVITYDVWFVIGASILNTSNSEFLLSISKLPEILEELH